MVTRTFLSKCTTIFQNSEDNFGLNPICMLNYGYLLSRCLLYFNIDNINSFSGYTCSDEAKHILKMTNCGSIDQRTFDEMLVSNDNKGLKERATSFEIIAFRIPEHWDSGRGFDNSTDYWLLGKNAASVHGANWYQAYDGKVWGTDIDETGEVTPVEGIVDLAPEYEKYVKNGRKYSSECLIIGSQRFEIGNENLEIDITPFVDNVLANNIENHGIGLAFAPYLESLTPKYTQYVGFFTNNTNTFFQPFIETRFRNKISDNRYSFYLGRANKLYFYANLGGMLTDLDVLPTCEVDGAEMPVKHANKGIYYAEVTLPSAEGNTIHYDNWSNLKYGGESIEDVEMEFVVLPKKSFFKLGDSVADKTNCVPSLSGIDDNEDVNQGEIRIVDVMFRIPYTTDYELMSNAEYRIYVKDGKREIDVIDWDDIDVMGMTNSFYVKTSELLPAEYHIDIRAKLGNELKIFKDKLKFNVVHNASGLKR